MEANPPPHHAAEATPATGRQRGGFMLVGASSSSFFQVPNQHQRFGVSSEGGMHTGSTSHFLSLDYSTVHLQCTAGFMLGGCFLPPSGLQLMAEAHSAHTLKIKLNKCYVSESLHTLWVESVLIIISSHKRCFLLMEQNLPPSLFLPASKMLHWGMAP